MYTELGEELLDLEIERAALARGLISTSVSRVRAEEDGVLAASADPEALWWRSASLPASGAGSERRRQWAFSLVENDRLAQLRGSCAHAWYEELHPVSEPEAGELSPRAVVHRILDDPHRRHVWARSFEAICSHAADVCIRWQEGRAELAALLRVDLGELESREAYQGVTHRWLALSEELYGGLGLEFPSWLDCALGSSCGDGWPGHLNWRTVQEVLGADSWLGASRPSFPAAPRALGAASWQRAFAIFGQCWADAQLTRARPFLLWRHPARLAEKARGGLLALLPLNGEFARRRQGLSRESALRQRRVLARSILCWTRWLSLRCLLEGGIGLGRPAFRSHFREAAAEALNFPLPGEFAGALPRLRPGAGPSLLGLLAAARTQARLVQSFDEDWFWNPRCCELLRDTFPQENAEEEPVSTLDLAPLYDLLESSLS